MLKDYIKIIAQKLKSGEKSLPGSGLYGNILNR